MSSMPPWAGKGMGHGECIVSFHFGIWTPSGPSDSHYPAIPHSFHRLGIQEIPCRFVHFAIISSWLTPRCCEEKAATGELLLTPLNTWGGPMACQVLHMWQALLDRARRELQRQEELVSLGKDGGKETGKGRTGCLQRTNLARQRIKECFRTLESYHEEQF